MALVREKTVPCKWTDVESQVGLTKCLAEGVVVFINLYTSNHKEEPPTRSLEQCFYASWNNTCELIKEKERKQYLTSTFHFVPFWWLALAMQGECRMLWSKVREFTWHDPCFWTDCTIGRQKHKTRFQLLARRPSKWSTQPLYYMATCIEEQQPIPIIFVSEPI